MHLYEVVVHLVAATDMLGLQLGAYNTFRWDVPSELLLAPVKDYTKGQT
jgi:hypothetical protein